MRLLVTGISGFIGRAVATAFVSAGGHEVWGWSRVRAPRSPVPEERTILADLLDERALSRVPDGLDVIVHCAAVATPAAALETPEEAVRVNTLGTARVFDLARRRRAAVVLASSVYVYEGTPEFPWHEELPLRPRSPLGASKLGAEAVARSYWDCFAVPSVAARLFTVFGPGASEWQFIPTAMRRVLGARSRVEFGNGDSTRDFVYIDDVVAALVACVGLLLRSPGHHVFNVAGGRERSIRECIVSILDVLGRRDLEVVFDRLPTRDDERGATRHWASIEKARRELGWRPMTPFGDGLRRTYHALRAEGDER